MTNKTNVLKIESFRKNDHVVCFQYGVGKVIEIQKKTIHEISCKFYVIFFEKEAMKISIPFHNAVSMRALTRDPKDWAEIFELCQAKAKQNKSTMWNKRETEYRNKINSGDIKLLAEVFRDLYRTEGEKLLSYGEKVIFDIAAYRIALEYSIVHDVSFDEAMTILTDNILNVRKTNVLPIDENKDIANTKENIVAPSNIDEESTLNLQSKNTVMANNSNQIQTLEDSSKTYKGNKETSVNLDTDTEDACL